MIYLYLASVVSNIVLWCRNAQKTKRMFATRYPNLTIPRSRWRDWIIRLLVRLIIIFCPVVNLAMLYAFIFQSDMLCEAIIEEIYKECMKEVHKYGHDDMGRERD